MPRIEHKGPGPLRINGVGQKTGLDKAGNQIVEKPGVEIYFGPDDPKTRQKLVAMHGEDTLQPNEQEVPAAVWLEARKLPQVQQALRQGLLIER